MPLLLLLPVVVIILICAYLYSGYTLHIIKLPWGFVTKVVIRNEGAIPRYLGNKSKSMAIRSLFKSQRCTAWYISTYFVYEFH